MPTYPISLIPILWLTATATLANQESIPNPELITVDVFTTATQPVTGLPENHRGRDDVTVVIHELDGIARFNHTLSKRLIRDPELAKQQVLRRFKKFDKAQYEALQHSAEALALALQLGVKRYPAIVLNSRWVVYGLLDVQAAMDRYRSWRLATAQ